MEHIPKPRVVQLDPNDPELIFGIPEEPTIEEPEPPLRDGKKEKRKSQLLMNKLNKIEQKISITTQKKDMFNLSNDDYYNPKLSEFTDLVCSVIGWTYVVILNSNLKALRPVW